MPLPLATDFTGSSVTEGGFKTAMTNLLDWLGGASSPVLKADATATLTKGFAAGTTAAANVSGTFTPAVADGNIRSFTLPANGTLAVHPPRGPMRLWSTVPPRCSRSRCRVRKGFRKHYGPVGVGNVVINRNAPVAFMTTFRARPP